MDLAARRRSFPALDVGDAGPRLAYLDSAASTLTPGVVIDAVASALRTLGNPGRGVYARSEEASDAIGRARDLAASALGGAGDQLVFTSGTTAAVNLVADTWGARVGEGDVILAWRAEHHSNLLPWQRVCERTRAQLVLVDADERGRFDVEHYRALLAQHAGRVKLVAVAHVSNVLGTIAPIADICRLAREAGARTFVDGAQAMAHLEVDAHQLGCDFYAFSGHKVYGPPGVGALWLRSDIAADLPPWQLGGGMVARVGSERSTWREPPARFEAGTPNTAGIAGLGAALAWTRDMQQASSIRDDEAAVLGALCDTIRDAGGRILGAPEIGVVSFVWDYHPHDIATIASGAGVALRSGHHCAQPIHERFGVPASTRASVAMYSGLDDVEQLGRALAQVRAVLGPR